MSQPPYAPPPGSGYGQATPPPPSNDKSVLFAVIGLCLFCCSPITILFGFLSMNEAKKAGKPTTLGLVTTIVGVVLLVGAVVSNIIYYSTR